jgi:hemolysin III
VILVWGLALVGIGLKAAGGLGHPRLSTGVYLAMGWLVLVAAKPLIAAIPPWGLFWLLSGGLVYTAGVGFFAAPRVRYTHFVWHLFVTGGTTCHFVAVLRYAG